MEQQQQPQMRSGTYVHNEGAVLNEQAQNLPPPQKCESANPKHNNLQHDPFSLAILNHKVKKMITEFKIECARVSYFEFQGAHNCHQILSEMPQVGKIDCAFYRRASSDLCSEWLRRHRNLESFLDDGFPWTTRKCFTSHYRHSDYSAVYQFTRDKKFYHVRGRFGSDDFVSEEVKFEPCYGQKVITFTSHYAVYKTDPTYQRFVLMLHGDLLLGDVAYYQYMHIKDATAPVVGEGCEVVSEAVPTP